MSDKEKRKSNPRRRLLIRLIIGIAIIVALVSVAMVALQPKGAQIVYIRHQKQEPSEDDYSGTSSTISNIWIANINRPDEARQLTFYEEGSISNMQVINNSHRLLYLHLGEIWTLDTQTGEYEVMMPCESCTALRLHPNGVWISYLDSDTPQREQLSLYIYDLETEETVFVTEHEHRDYAFRSIFWVMDSKLLAFNQPVSEGSSNQEIIFYDFETREIMQQQLIETEFGYYYPSPNGTRYITWLSALDFTDIPVIGTLPRLLNIHDNASDETTVLYPYSPYPDGHLRSVRIAGWHPDSGSFVTLETWDVDASNTSRYDYNLYDIETGEHHPLITVNSAYDAYGANFNHDGSRLVFFAYLTPQSLQSQLVVYDLNTNQETILPLFGSSPRWVNGGR